MRSLNMVQFRHGRDVLFRLLMIIGIIALAGGLSSAEAKHDGWGIRASIRAGTSTVGEIRVGTWAGISTHGSIRAGIEVPALARPKRRSTDGSRRSWFRCWGSADLLVRPKGVLFRFNIADSVDADKGTDLKVQ